MIAVSGNLQTGEIGSVRGHYLLTTQSKAMSEERIDSVS